MATIEKLYQEIGQELARKIPEKWDSAEIIFDSRPGVSTIKASYQPVNAAEKQQIVAGRKLIKMFVELHERLIESGQDDWIRAIYTLQPDGKFELRFEY